MTGPAWPRLVGMLQEGMNKEGHLGSVVHWAPALLFPCQPTTWRSACWWFLLIPRLVYWKVLLVFVNALMLLVIVGSSWWSSPLEAQSLRNSCEQRWVFTKSHVWAIAVTASEQVLNTSPSSETLGVWEAKPGSFAPEKTLRSKSSSPLCPLICSACAPPSPEKHYQCCLVKASEAWDS